MWKCLSCFVLLAFGLVVSSPAQVIITEIMANNETGLQDEDREYSDWIEILNTTGAAVNLQGWSLSDDHENLAKWKFPATNLAANAYMVVFASGKDRAVAGKNLHTSFSLSSGGEYLALVQPDGRTITREFSPEFPQQNANVSYGFAGGTTTQLRFFSPPSPGAVNAAGASDLSDEPVYSIAGGIYTNTVSVALSSPQTGAVIRYTLNGAEPTTASTAYTTPISVANTTVIRAKSFVPNLVPSATVTRTYTILSPELFNFSSNLPILVLTTFGRAPTPDVNVQASATLIGTNGGRAFLRGSPDFDGRSVIKIRGSSSVSFPKKSYALELQDELLLDRKASLLGMPRESDWILYAPYTDKTLMRDFLAYELSNEIGDYASRTRFIEVYVDASGGKLAQGDYVGIYMLTEKIKRDNKRVDIDELLPTQTTPPEVTGGYIFKKDRLDPGDAGFTTTRAGVFGYVEPKEQQIATAQRSYLASYLAQFETALYSATFTNRAYTNFYNVLAGIDHHWIVEATKNIDGFRLSTFVHKDRLGKITMGPVWDYNLTLGNADYLEGWLTNGWYAPNVGDSEYPWYRQLFRDPEFNQQYIDRWFEIRRSAFATARVLKRVDEIAAALNEAAARNYVRWPILGTYVWPNAPGANTRTTYKSEVDWMKNWIAGRFAWIDSQFLKPPVLSHSGGPITAGLTLTISGVTDPVYYTLDGSDPRLPAGQVSSKAARYTGPIRIDNNARVVARATTATTSWSAPAVATYVVNTPQLAITEIMFNPAYDETRDYEFIELKNVGSATFDLKGFHFSSGIAFVFTNTLNLTPGKMVVLVKDMAAFTARFDTVTNVVGQYNGSLDNSGERIALDGPMREPILDFSFNNAWYPVTDGYGFSLVIQDVRAPFSTWGRRNSWRASANLGGSPGQDDPAISRPAIVINEIATHTDPPAVDMIELFNPGATAVDIGNWFLTDDPGNARKFKIPPDTTIPAGEYRFFTEAEFNKDPLATNSFALSSSGDEVYLFSADSGGNLTGVSDGFQYGPSANGVTFGRFVTSDGDAHYPAQISATIGAANSGPRIGPVVINEIRYAPAAFESEFVELRNITAQAVNLFDSARPTNTWRINGLDFSFPTNIVIPANGLLILAQTDPARFRASNNVPIHIPIFGPYAGALQDDGEMIQLQRPDVPEPLPNGSVRIPMIVVDEVRFNDKAPWPTNATGPGVSLERIYANQYGNEPANWRAAVGGSSPGLDNNVNRPPVVRLPTDQSIIAERYPHAVTFTADVWDDGQPTNIVLHWTQTSGPHQSRFSSTNSASTTIELLAPGTYQFRLRASDSALEGSSTMNVTIQRPVGLTQFVPFGSLWNFFDQGGDLGKAWYSNDFVMNGWRSGNTQIGYGDGDEVTLAGYGPDANNKHITTYFRKTFDLTEAASVRSLTLRFVRDDGIVVYINGKEAFRDANMPAGEITYTTLARAAIAGADESAIISTNLDWKMLRNGVNVVAAEVHQNGAGSSDMTFDLQLEGLTGGVNQAPMVNAGPDLEVAAGDWLPINGSVYDDALPSAPGIPTIAWASETAPADVTFSRGDIPRIAAKFNKAGTYTLSLTANDGALSTTDRLVVTVRAEDAFTIWRRQYFTEIEMTDPAIGGPDADPDADGLTNNQEFICGTDPRSAASALRLAFTISAGPVLQFQAIANRGYALYFRASLETGAWNQIATFPAEATDRMVQHSDAQPGYYRLAVP